MRCVLETGNIIQVAVINAYHVSRDWLTICVADAMHDMETDWEELAQLPIRRATVMGKYGR